MKKFSTQCMNLFDNKKKGDEEVKITSPRKQTLDLISQFARTYHVESAVHSELSGLVMN